MTLFEFNPTVHLLLVPDSNETVRMDYINRNHSWPMPLIGPRPPYYANPQYTPFYPKL